MLDGYARSLRWALRYRGLVMVLLAATVAFNIYLYMKIPKGFFPQQDTGRLIGGIQADQAISFQSMSVKLRQFIHIVQSRPGGRHGGRLHRRRLGRRRAGEQRLHLRLAQAQGRATACRPTRSSGGCARS